MADSAAAVITIGGLPKHVAIEMFKGDDWFSTPNVGDRVINGVLYKPRCVNMRVIRAVNGDACYSGTKETTDAEGFIPIRAYSKEEREAIDINTPLTQELLAAVLFSAIGNGVVLRLMKDEFETNGVPSSKAECIAMAHLLWAAGQWDVACLNKDLVCKAVCDLTGLTLTTEMFKRLDMPSDHLYRVALSDLVATPPAHLQETFELDWNRFCANAKALGYTIEF